MLTQWQLSCIARVLIGGGVIAYPTESVYGIGCLFDQFNAIEKILDVKNRPASKGLILLVSDFSQVNSLICPLTARQLHQLNSCQKRATTWLLPRRQETSSLLSGNNDTLAVRLTQNPVARQICQKMNKAIVSTSCNITGKPELDRTTLVRNQMIKELDLVVGGSCGGQRNSRIIDLISNTVLRD